MSTEHHNQQGAGQQRPGGDAADRAGRPRAADQQVAGLLSGRKYFLGIAIDEYQHWPKLRNAKRDVMAISRLLTETYGFSEADMIFLRDGEATSEGIINTLHSLVSVVSPNDSLVIYYAGHGHFDDSTKRGYWVPVNARNRVIPDYIQNSVIKDYLNDIPSLHTLLFSDSCFAGSLFVRGYQRDGLLTAKELLQLQSRWALCSGRHNETVADGPPNGHSPFAESILDVLGKSDREYITLDFLLEQVRNQTRANYSQLPDGGPLMFADHKRGQFVFMREQVNKKPADELAWGKITAMPQETLNQVNTKIIEVDSFCNIHAESNFCHEAIRLGIALEARREYLKVKDSRSSFVLRDFLRSYPNSPYEAEIRKKLEEINIGSTQPPPVPPPEPEPPPPVEHRAAPVSAPVPPTEPIVTSEPITEPLQGGGHNSSREQQEVWIKRAAIAIVVIAVLSLGSYVLRNLTGGGSEKETQQTAQLPDSTPADPADGAASDTGQQGNEAATSPTPAKNIDQVDGAGQQTAAVVPPPSRSKPTEETRQVDTRRENPRPAEPQRRPDPEPEPIVNTRSPSTYTDASAGTFVLVQGGSFNMGCTSEQQGCDSDEKPVHRVTLGSYYIGQYEVTQAQWRAVMGNNPSNFKGCDQCPVEQVSWNDVQDFIRRLNERTGQNYRLPTEAEWEFAARGGNNSQGYQYAGSGNIGDVGWYGSNSGSKTHPVGQKRANELGLYDMSGNVYEWCQDWKGDYSASAQTNPRGPSTGAYRVLRGGSWGDDPQGCRVAGRSGGVPGYRGDNLGFRLARTP